MELRIDLQSVVRELLAESEPQAALGVDRIGAAIGTLSVSTEEIEAIFVALEAQGRQVSAPPGGGGEQRLRRVVEAARSLKVESSARPTLNAVAARAGLTHDDVLGALFLLRIMQRG